MVYNPSPCIINFKNPNASIFKLTHSTDHKCIVLISNIEYTTVCNSKSRWIYNSTQVFPTQRAYVNVCFIIICRHCKIFKFHCSTLIYDAGECF